MHGKYLALLFDATDGYRPNMRDATTGKMRVPVIHRI